MLDNGHLGGSVAGTQAREIITEHHIENPVQSVLDPPVTADYPREGFDVEPGRTEIEAPFPFDASIALGLALDHADGGEAGKAELSRMAAVGEQPVHVMANRVLAGFDAAVIGIDGLAVPDVQTDGWIGEDPRHLGIGGGPVLLQRQHIVTIAIAHGLGDRGLCSHDIDGDKRTLPVQALQHQRDGGDFVRLLLDCLLAERQSLARGPWPVARGPWPRLRRYAAAGGPCCGG